MIQNLEDLACLMPFALSKVGTSTIVSGPVLHPDLCVDQLQ